MGNNIFLLVGPLGLVCALDMFIFLSVSQQVPTAKVCSEELFCCADLGVSDVTKNTNSFWCWSRGCILLMGELCTQHSSRLPVLADIFILFTLILIVLLLLLSGPRDMLYLEFLFRASVHLMKTSSCSVGKRCFNFVLSYVLNERPSSS